LDVFSRPFGTKERGLQSANRYYCALETRGMNSALRQIPVA
jgi:hypothetical protein